MKKSIFSFCIVMLLIFCCSFIFVACDNEAKVPSEAELVQSGYSLNTALPVFNELVDNYAYREEIHQTNGEDWFSYNFIKLDNGNIYQQSAFINNNTGWKAKDGVFTDYTDHTDVSYTIYAKQSSNYIMYCKYKYDSTDEEFQKYSHSYNLPDNNLRANRFYYDYSFLNIDDFEYFELSNDEGGNDVYWKAKTDVLTNSDFKTDIMEAFDRGTENLDDKRIDSAIIKVENNIVVSFSFNYWGGYNDQNHYYITIDFDYENYDFNLAGLTSGFTPYVPD